MRYAGTSLVIRKICPDDDPTRQCGTSTAALARWEGCDRPVPEQRRESGSGNRSMAASRYQ
jgi:hypothetical protein